MIPQMETATPAGGPKDFVAAYDIAENMPELGQAQELADVASSSMVIADITVGARHRKDLGDIEALARSIEEVGLLHPVVVTPDGTLIAGARRIAAYNHLGRDRVPVRVVSIDAIARGEAAENFERKAFSPSEAIAIKRVLGPECKAAAKERQGTRTDLLPGNLPESSRGDSRDKAAAFTGYGARTLDKAEAIVAAAEAEPEKFAQFVEDMDRTGKVDGAYERMKATKQMEAPPAESTEKGGRPKGAPGKAQIEKLMAALQVILDDDVPKKRMALGYETQKLVRRAAKKLSALLPPEKAKKPRPEQLFRRAEDAVAAMDIGTRTKFLRKKAEERGFELRAVAGSGVEQRPPPPGSLTTTAPQRSTRMMCSCMT
jgi:hypothetical protein